MSSATVFYRLASTIVLPRFKQKIVGIDGIENCPANGGFILAANHVDWLDGFYLIAAIDAAQHRPVHFLTQTNNYWWSTIALPIPAERSAIITAATRYLQSGKIICNFPEARRNSTKYLLPGKTGTVRMAATAGVPIVPVGITCDSGRNMGQSLQFLLSSAHPVRLRFGAPLRCSIPSSGISAEWLTTETERLMRAIAPLCDKQYSS